MCVTGLVLPAELDHLAQRAFEDYGGFGKGFRRRWYRAELSGTVPNAGRLWATGNCGTGANMAYRRCVFSSTGLFDPALDVGTLTGGGGDLEMFFRVIKHGWTLLYDPAAFVWHRHRRTLPELKRQIESFGSVAYGFMPARTDPVKSAVCARRGTSQAVAIRLAIPAEPPGSHGRSWSGSPRSSDGPW